MISYTLRLRKFFTSLFDDMKIKNSYIKAPRNAELPYITFELREIEGSVDAYNARRFILEINGYDRSSIQVLDSLSDKITTILEGFKRPCPPGMVLIYPAYGRLNIQDETEIWRQRLTFDVYYYTC